MNARAGSVLIVIAGVAALLASLSMAFLIRMRSDSDESALLMREAQAHIMLSAGLMYVAETSRLGWQPDSAPHPIEAFGWVDVRTGKPGPRDQSGQMLFVGDDTTGVGKAYPAVGTATRCPTHVLERPPCAIANDMTPNPIAADPTRSWADLVGFSAPDPRPIGTDWSDFLRGDPRPRPTSEGRSWFRVYRKSPAVFVITCGAGATLGFRDYADATREGAAAAFGSADLFADLRQHETILWYEAEWNPAVWSPMGYTTDQQHAQTIRPADFNSPFVSPSTFPNPRNLVGSFLYIERLADEPPQW